MARSRAAKKSYAVEASAGWVAELGTRSDSSTPQVGKYEHQVHELYAMPKISQKLIDDAATDDCYWRQSLTGLAFVGDELWVVRQRRDVPRVAATASNAFE